MDLGINTGFSNGSYRSGNIKNAEELHKAAVELSLSMNNIRVSNRLDMENRDCSDEFSGKLDNPHDEVCMGQYAIDMSGPNQPEMCSVGVNECISLAVIIGEYRLLAHINVTEAYADDRLNGRTILDPKADDLSPNPVAILNELIQDVNPVNYTIFIAGGVSDSELNCLITNLVTSTCRHLIPYFDKTRITSVYQPYKYIPNLVDNSVNVSISPTGTIEMFNADITI